MLCKKCGKELKGKQQSYCSQYCSKLHLKSLYKKRNKEKISAYNKKRRAEGHLSSSFPHSCKVELKKDKCLICGTDEELTVNHIRPVSVGGTDEQENIEILCLSCNSRDYHVLLKAALRYYFEAVDQGLIQPNWR